MKKINMDAEDILNKSFSVQYKGYVPEEVDEFLDRVLKEFRVIKEIEEYYETQNTALKKSNSILRNRVDKLETDIELIKSEQSEINSDEAKSSNLELLKKIADLESKLHKANKEIEELK